MAEKLKKRRAEGWTGPVGDWLNNPIAEV